LPEIILSKKKGKHMNTKELIKRGRKMSATGKRIGYELAATMDKILKAPDRDSVAKAEGRTIDEILQQMADNALPMNDGYLKIVSVYRRFPKREDWKRKTFQELYEANRYAENKDRNAVARIGPHGPQQEWKDKYVELERKYKTALAEIASLRRRLNRFLNAAKIAEEAELQTQ
jgi:hypothetical protein